MMQYAHDDQRDKLFLMLHSICMDHFINRDQISFIVIIHTFDAFSIGSSDFSSFYLYLSNGLSSSIVISLNYIKYVHL